MAFTKRTITHKFTEGSGAAASGSVTFTLSKRITNGNETIVPSSITSTLNGSGELSQELISNVDTGTNPTDSQWRMEWRFGSTVESFEIVVPTGPGTTELGKLLPEQPFGG